MKFSDEQVTQLKQIIHDEVKSELKPIKRDMRAMRKDLNWVMGKYDTRFCSLELHTTHPLKSVDFSLTV